MGIGNSDTKFKNKLSDISNAFRKKGVFSSVSIMKTNSFKEGVNFGNQALDSAFFKPNIVFLTSLESDEILSDYRAIIEEARELELGVILYVPHPKAMLGHQQTINIWIDKDNGNWNIENGIGNLNLSMLTAYKLKENWNANIRLIATVEDKSMENKAIEYLKNIIHLARLPIFDIQTKVGRVSDENIEIPYADLNIFPLTGNSEIKLLIDQAEKTNTSCLFIKDSGVENIFA
jgi:hypothetical protein